MTLYEMTQSASALYELLCAEEIDEQVFADTLEAMGTGEKLESCCQVIKELEADADKFDKEIKRMTAKKKTAQNGIDRIKDNMLNFLNAIGSDKEETEHFKVSKRTSQSVEIVDESKIPAEFIKPAKVEFSKTEIGKVLKAGGTVEGATICVKESVQIR